MIKALVFLAACVLATSTAQAHSIKAKALTIVHPWCVETDDTAKPVVVSMTIQNAGAKGDRLLRASTPMAEKAELRAGTPPDLEGAVIPSVPVGARGEVNLKRGGPHVLLSGVKQQLAPPDSFLMTLTFERAGKVEVEVVVEDAKVLEPTKH
jgi:copper(I)-binding protein